MEIAPFLTLGLAVAGDATDADLLLACVETRAVPERAPEIARVRVPADS